MSGDEMKFRARTEPWKVLLGLGLVGTSRGWHAAYKRVRRDLSSGKVRLTGFTRNANLSALYNVADVGD